MQIYERQHGEEQPFWPLGPFKLRLPLVHYRWETSEMVQALIMFVTSLAMIPLIEQHLGVPYDVALCYVVVCGVAYLLPATLGVPMVPGWITPAIPVVVLFLSRFEPGPDAIRALVALQLLVALLFFFFAVTRLGTTFVRRIPASLKAGIIIGAGIAAITGEIREGGRLATTPISIVIGGVLSIYLLFSESFKAWATQHSVAKTLANYGMVPALVAAMVIGWVVFEYDFPQIQFGITRLDLGEYWNYLPFTVGMPTTEMFILALPTALIAYIIAFGDIIVGSALIKRVDDFRKDEAIDIDIDRVHWVTAIRNLIHAFLAPYPGLSGPLWTAVTASIGERYKLGRNAMESIYSGGGTFWFTGLIALFILPLVSLFQPVLPIALSLTLLVTGYVCIFLGLEQVQTSTQRGVAGVVAVVLASGGPNGASQPESGA